MSAARIFRYDLHNHVFGHTLILQKEPSVRRLLDTGLGAT